MYMVDSVKDFQDRHRHILNNKRSTMNSRKLTNNPSWSEVMKKWLTHGECDFEVP